jgi:hypothetical protein
MTTWEEQTPETDMVWNTQESQLADCDKEHRGQDLILSRRGTAAA